MKRLCLHHPQLYRDVSQGRVCGIYSEIPSDAFLWSFIHLFLLDFMPGCSQTKCEIMGLKFLNICEVQQWIKAFPDLYLNNRNKVRQFGYVVVRTIPGLCYLGHI